MCKASRLYVESIYVVTYIFASNTTPWQSLTAHQEYIIEYILLLHMYTGNVWKHDSCVHDMGHNNEWIAINGNPWTTMHAQVTKQQQW
jgi:hypothetical protein